MWLTHDRKKLFRGSAVGFIGFLLSPLSWWNDLVINIPLAYLFALVVSFLGHLVMPISIAVFLILFGLGYWLTNILGFVLLHLGIHELTASKQPHLIKDLIISIVYTVAVAVLATIGFLQPVADQIHLLPSWVVR